MPTDASFRFSTYLTLALMCVALGYAEYALLPEVAVFATLCVIGLGVLYFLESRVQFLSIPAAQRLGMMVGLLYLMWAAYRVKRELSSGEFMNMGWHMFIVGMFGPLLMLLVVAKVARSDKHAGDYWTLHGVALTGIGLSAAFAEEPLSFVLVGLYLVAAVWSLTLLHLGRASGAVPPIPGGRPPATKTVTVSADPTGHRLDLAPAILWAFVALVVAVPLYLLTPRSDADKAILGTPRMEVGFAADQMIDLNRTGPLKTNTETAFEFTATHPDGSPKTDVPTDQRWRGRTYRHYSAGEWKVPRDEKLLPGITHADARGREAGLAVRADHWTPPKLGPGQYRLAFNVPAEVSGWFVADPVIWVPDEPAPLAAETNQGLRGMLPIPDGTFYWDWSQRPSGSPRRYVQEYRERDDPDASPPFRFVGRDRDVHEQLAHIRQNPVPRVKQYADAVLKEFQAAGKLPADEELLSKWGTLPDERYHDAIARAFTVHLATAPTFTYTTDLRRAKKDVDPIEDFLFHSKTGHCERFATALVLMLRSQGIPAMLVLGFKGCEHTGDGKYLVNQEHAHAWVQALIPKPGEPGVYQWRSLDPTPGGADAGGASVAWWRQAGDWVDAQFTKYLTNYTADQRRKALADLVARLARRETLFVLAGLVLLALGARSARRRFARRVEAALVVEAAPWFKELAALLAAHGITPAPGDTAREFALAAGVALTERGCAEVAGVPLAWAEAYYQERFGGVPPSDARMAELEAGLDSLRRALEQ